MQEPLLINALNAHLKNISSIKSFRIILALGLLALSLTSAPALFGQYQYMKAYFVVIGLLCLINIVIPFAGKRGRWLIVLPCVLAFCLCALAFYEHGMCKGFDWCTI